MIFDLKQSQKNLYDTDYNLWLEETVKQLQAQDFNAIDWENLIEEIASLGRSEKRRIEILLIRLFEHLLKLAYWRATPRRRQAQGNARGEKERNYNQNHWKREIRNFRKQIKKELKASPSLKNYLLKVFEDCYQDSRELVADVSELPLDNFPPSPIGHIEQILDENWLP